MNNQTNQNNAELRGLISLNVTNSDNWSVAPLSYRIKRWSFCFLIGQVEFFFLTC